MYFGNGCDNEAGASDAKNSRVGACPGSPSPFQGSGQAAVRAGGAWPLRHCSYHFNRKSKIVIRHSLAEPWPSRLQPIVGPMVLLDFINKRNFNIPYLLPSSKDNLRPYQYPFSPAFLNICSRWSIIVVAFSLVQRPRSIFESNILEYSDVNCIIEQFINCCAFSGMA